MTCAGIDFSTTRIDLVLLDQDEPGRARAIPIALPSSRNRADSFNNARHLRQVFPSPSFWQDEDIWLVGIERPYGPSRGAIAALHRIQGAIAALVPEAVTVVEVTPGEWRRELGLKGNASKAACCFAVCKQLGDPDARRQVWAGWSADAYDAWAIGYAALRMNERGIGRAA